jgi:hypothetical protein
MAVESARVPRESQTDTLRMSLERANSFEDVQHAMLGMVGLVFKSVEEPLTSLEYARRLISILPTKVPERAQEFVRTKLQSEDPQEKSAAGLTCVTLNTKSIVHAIDHAIDSGLMTNSSRIKLEKLYDLVYDDVLGAVCAGKLGANNEIFSRRGRCQTRR